MTLKQREKSQNMWSDRIQRGRDKDSLGIVRRSFLKWQKRNIPVKIVDWRIQQQDKVADPITRNNEERMLWRTVDCASIAPVKQNYAEQPHITLPVFPWGGEG